jgi:hypothetical protein
MQNITKYIDVKIFFPFCMLTNDKTDLGFIYKKVGSSEVGSNMFLESNASLIPRTYVGSSIPGTYLASSTPGT